MAFPGVHSSDPYAARFFSPQRHRDTEGDGDFTGSSSVPLCVCTTHPRFVRGPRRFSSDPRARQRFGVRQPQLPLLYATGVAETSKHDLAKRNAGVLAGWCGGVPRRHSLAVAKLLIWDLSRDRQTAAARRHRASRRDASVPPTASSSFARIRADSAVPEDNGCLHHSFAASGIQKR